MNALSLVCISLVFATCVPAANAQSFLTDLKAEHDPARRAKKALDFADAAFGSAQALYAGGEIKEADSKLEDMTSALNECVRSLATAHKWSLDKKAELRVAYLQRRIRGLVDDIAIQKRGWAEYTERRLDEIHDRILDMVIQK